MLRAPDEIVNETYGGRSCGARGVCSRNLLRIVQDLARVRLGR
ncbi:hypothetical protein [Streptomyces wuyuanensis]